MQIFLCFGTKLRRTTTDLSITVFILYEKESYFKVKWKRAGIVSVSSVGISSVMLNRNMKYH